jgi:hypothetical protein
VASLLLPGLAAGQAPAPETAPAGLAQGTRFIVGIERIAGFHHLSSSAHYTPSADWTFAQLDQSPSEQRDHFAVLWPGDSQSGLGVNPYAIPRFCFDVKLVPGLTFGGGIAFNKSSGTSRPFVLYQGSTDPVSLDHSVSWFSVSPRVGFLAMFNGTLGIWPRLGMTYVRLNEYQQQRQSVSASGRAGTNSQVGNSHVESSYLSIDPELLLVVTPSPHFGFLLGVQTAFGVGGGFTYSMTHAPYPPLSIPDGDLKATDIGVTGGLIGWL